MDFFDKIFGEQKIVKKNEIIKFRLSELEKWLKDERERREKEIHREAGSILDDIQKGIKNIHDLVLRIDALECPEEIPKRARKVILTSKPAFIRGILDAVKNIREKPEDKDLHGFTKDLQNTLSALFKVLIGQGRYLSLAFGEELEGIKKEAKHLSENEKELERLTSDNSLIYIEKDFRIFKERFSLLHHLDKERSELISELEKLNFDKENLQNEYNGIEKRKEFKNFLEKEDRLKEIKEEKDRIESNVYNLITPLKRPLKRFRKFIQEKSTSKEISIRDIDSYMQNPMDIFLFTNDNKIDLLLKCIRESLDSGKFEIKEQEKKKTISRINSILNTDLRKLKENLLFLKKEEKRISNEIGSSFILLEKNDLEKKIGKTSREIALKEDEIEKIKKKRGKLADEIEKLKRDLEGKLSNLEEKNVILDFQ